MMLPFCGWTIACLALQYTPGGYDLGFALLGVVLGPVVAWQSFVAMRQREGDFDRELSHWTWAGALLMLLAGVAVTAGSGWWLIRWLPEYLQW